MVASWVPVDVDPDEEARRRQLLAERRERIERRDRAEAALGITWQPLDVDTFGADEPERAPPSGHGAIVAALREWEALRPAWQHEAACRNVVDVSFFPNRGESAEPAKAVCARCPVAGPCKDYALENGIRHGIWGGESGRRKRHKAA